MITVFSKIKPLAMVFGFFAMTMSMFLAFAHQVLAQTPDSFEPVDMFEWN